MSDAERYDDTACQSCGAPVRADFPDPIPEGAVVSWLEELTGRAWYCGPCFEAMDGEDT